MIDLRRCAKMARSTCDGAPKLVSRRDGRKGRSTKGRVSSLLVHGDIMPAVALILGECALCGVIWVCLRRTFRTGIKNHRFWSSQLCEQQFPDTKLDGSRRWDSYMTTSLADYHLIKSFWPSIFMRTNRICHYGYSDRRDVRSTRDWTNIRRNSTNMYHKNNRESRMHSLAFRFPRVALVNLIQHLVETRSAMLPLRKTDFRWTKNQYIYTMFRKITLLLINRTKVSCNRFQFLVILCCACPWMLAKDQS
jgi:hypothetical protein